MVLKLILFIAALTFGSLILSLFSVGYIYFAIFGLIVGASIGAV